jgi:hypothetical protein
LLGINKIYNKVIDGKANDEVKLNKRGHKSLSFKRGCVSVEHNRCRFIYMTYENNNQIKKSKTFNINKYGSKENALKALEDFRNQIYPIENL